MTFTYSLATNVGKVRNMIGDDTESTALMTDEDIDALITQYGGDLLLAAAACLRRMAAKKARDAYSESAGDYSVNKSNQYRAMLDVAKALEEMAMTEPADAEVEQILTQFNYNSILQAKVLRGESLED